MLMKQLKCFMEFVLSVIYVQHVSPNAFEIFYFCKFLVYILKKLNSHLSVYFPVLCLRC